MSDDCFFCKIVEGTAPASVVYSDGSVMAFMDIAPIVPGHLLVIPRRHAVLVGDLEGSEGSTCWMIASWLAKALRSSGLRGRKSTSSSLTARQPSRTCPTST